MSTELRLRGHINGQVEYFATAAGCRLPHHHFYSMEDERVRFFSPGNELVLTPETVIQRGTGGTLCGYMYGDELPPADLIRHEVVNRLTLTGATIDEQGQLQWSDRLQTVLDYARIFTQGHPIHNYFFFIHGLEGDSSQMRQKNLLRLLGKTLKRLPQPAQADDSNLAARMLSLLPAGCTLYLLRLTHAHNSHFQQELRNLYYPQRNMADIRINALSELAASLDIAPSQQERIRLDVIYRHRDNYRVADSYRKLLLTCAAQGRMSKTQQEQTLRIKAMALRQQVPEILLKTLDHKFLAKLSAPTAQEEYFSTAARLLKRLTEGHPLDNEQIAALLTARQQARKQHDYRVDNDIDKYRNTLKDRHSADSRQLEIQQFNSILSMLDSIDTTTTAINRIVFLDNHLPAETIIHQLLTRHQEFHCLCPGLFERLFFSDLHKNCYIGNFGRRKLTHLKQGLKAVIAGHLRVSELYEELEFITHEEQQYRDVLAAARAWLQTNGASIMNKSSQDALYQTLSREQSANQMLNLRLNSQLFEKVVHDLHMEHLYLHEFLPEIIHKDDRGMREDFFTNSGLDYFQIEEIELAYARDKNLDPERLQRLQCNL